MKETHCPKCGTPWEEEETIYEHFLQRYGSEEKARETAAMYGCTPENPKHFGKDVVGIEIPGKYDGVSYWQCQKCDTVFDRWTMKETTIED